MWPSGWHAVKAWVAVVVVTAAATLANAAASVAALSHLSESGSDFKERLANAAMSVAALSHPVALEKVHPVLGVGDASVLGESDASAEVLLAEMRSGLAVDGSSACWDLIQPTSFTDTGNLDAESLAAVDCLAHYGITKGVSSTAYRPSAHSTRLQMARFLVRTIEALELPQPDEVAHPFDDLGSVDASGMLAVARLYELGIVAGRTQSRFIPDDGVQRAQMALMLHRLLKLAGVDMPTLGSGGVSGSVGSGGVSGVSFTDLEGRSASTVTAIRQLVKLGIMEGVAPNIFGPRVLVTREDAALYLARVLDVAGARPARMEVTVSPSSILVGGASEATITVRKPDGQPYRGLLVDVFAAYRLPGSGGAVCSDVLVEALQINGGDAGTSRNCRVDSADPRTDSTGTVRVGLTIRSSYAGVSHIYAWVGPPGRAFGGASRVHDYAVFGWQPPPTGMTISVAPDRPAFGQNVTVTASLTGRSPYGMRLVFLVKAEDGRRVRVWQVGESAGGGSASFLLASPAYAANGRAGRQPVTETLTVFWDRNGNSVHDGPSELSAQTVLTWH